jgi:rare lipoprotein A
LKIFRPKTSKLNFIYIFKWLIVALSCSLYNINGNNSWLCANEFSIYQGRYKVGKPYQVKSITYYPEKNPKINHTEVGLASWYGSKDHNKQTANGDKFSKYLLTAAHPKLPMPSIIKVTNLINNKSLILMVNDRGPFYKNRVLDVSEAAAEKLDFKHIGSVKIKLEYLHKESQDLLVRLNLKKDSKAKSNSPLLNCSAGRYIEMLNAKHKLLPPNLEHKKLYAKLYP